jgi:Tol biopolymer transport system component
VGGWDIWVMNADGTGMTNLTNHPSFDSEPTWSPDGSKIAFSSTRNGPAELYVMNADGSGVTQITFYNSLGGSALHADWSPNGQWIAFTWTGPTDDQVEIYRVKPDGTQVTQVTDTPADENTPSWSPDSKRIGFLKNGDIWTMTANGTGLFNLTNTPGVFESGPAWSR